MANANGPAGEKVHPKRKLTEILSSNFFCREHTYVGNQFNYLPAIHKMKRQIYSI